MLSLNNILLNKIYSNTKDLFISLNNVNYTVVKGEILSKLAYNKPAMRHVGDIDILISRCNLNKVIDCLKNNGYKTSNNNRLDYITLLTQSHQTFPWVKQVSSYASSVIDLNFDIFWGEYEGKRVDIDEFISNNIELEIYGCKVKALTPIKAMIQLILHHYKDLNSIFLLATRNSIQYNMFKDVYYLLKNNLNEITIEKLYSLSAEYEIIPYVFYILYYTGKVFDNDILNKYVEAFRTEEGEKLLNCYGLCESERKEWKYDFNTRLTTDNLYELIKDDLTKKDNEKIAINKRVFLGEVE